MERLQSQARRYFVGHTSEQQFLEKTLQFGSGEYHLQISLPVPVRAEILFRYQGDQSMIQLLLLTDALRRHGAKYIDLLVPYFPGARQDRVCLEGEPLSVKVYADLINQQQFNNVIVFDPHSDVVVALLNNVKVIKNSRFIGDVVNRLHEQDFATDIVLVAPDAGANKKIFSLATELGGLPVIRADKVRDLSTGRIVSTEVYCGDLTGKTALIVDDICSGGRTFIELASELKMKGAAKVILAVSHYEGVADFQKMNNSGIDFIYTTDSINNLSSSDFIAVESVCNYVYVQGA